MTNARSLIVYLHLQIDREDHSYHFHRKNNFGNVIDYCVHEHRLLRAMRKVERYKRSNENILDDNTIQEIRSPWLNHVLW